MENCRKDSHYYDEKTNKILLVGSAASVGIGSVFLAQQSQAAPDPSVQAVVTSITDTLPILTGITMLVFSAGLGPWAARTTLGWLSSIMRGHV